MSFYMLSNLVKGFSFENDGNSDGRADFWQPSDSGNTTYSLNNSASNVKHGTYAQKCVCVGTSGGVYQDLKNITASAEHTVLFWNKIDAGQMDCIVQAYNSSHAYISSPYSGTSSQATLTRQTAVFTTPANTDWLRLYLRQTIGAGNTTFEVDGVCLTKSGDIEIDDEPNSWGFNNKSKQETRQLVDGTVRFVSPPAEHDTLLDSPALQFRIINKSQKDELLTFLNTNTVVENHLGEIFNLYATGVGVSYLPGTDPTLYDITMQFEDYEE